MKFEQFYDIHSGFLRSDPSLYIYVFFRITDGDFLTKLLTYQMSNDCTEVRVDVCRLDRHWRFLMDQDRQCGVL
ncbi:hypothetical protein RUM43_011217 [Polyplax serrata]|uniref:Uncharacterized protein n=1 Tax=Polyplax serrata TaxID=468196 RepID=A0AAN8P4U4_POLSC